MEVPGVRLVRIPLVPVAVAVAAGILAGRFVPMPGASWAALAAAGMATGAALAFRAHLRPIAQAALLAAVAALAAVHARGAYFTVPDDHILSFTSASRTLATVRGRIVTAPQIVQPLPGQPFTYRRPPQTIFLLEASALGGGAKARPVSGLVRAAIDEPMADLRMGQEVELVGWIGRFREPSNPGQYDSAQAGRYSGVLVWCSVPLGSGAAVIEGGGGSWAGRLLRRMKASASQHFAGGDDEEPGLLAQALLVGQRHPALGRLNEVMVRAGIAHYLSISGTHLGIFLGFVYLLCRLAAFTRSRASVFVLAVLALYVLAAEPNPPLLRSAAMAAAVCLAALARRQYGSLNALAGAAVVLLAVEPMGLFSAGFQLSFGIVLGLVLLSRPIHRLLWGRWLARQGLVVYRSDRRASRWLARTIGGWLRSGATMSLSAWIVSLPLAAWHFGLVSPYGQVLTAILLLPVAAVLIPGYFSLALAWAAPNLSDAVGRLAEQAAAGLAWVAHGLRYLPGLCIEVRPVGPAWAAMCYAAVALWLWRRRVPFGSAAAVAASAVLVGWTVYTQLPARAPRGIEVNLLAVGDGQCAVVRTAGGGTFLCDAGTRSTIDVARQVLRPFLRERCLPQPAVAFVSHANADHYSAVADLAAEGRLRRVYLNEQFGRPLAPGKEPDYNELLFLRILEESGVEVGRVAAGSVVPLDETARVEVLWPPAGGVPPRTTRSGATMETDVNDTSLMLRVVCSGGSVLFPGDAGALPQAELLKEPNRIRCDVLVMPHHGAWSDQLPAFVQAAGAKAVLVSRSIEPQAPASASRTTTAAAGDFYARLRASRSFYSTARNGWVRVAASPGELEVQTMR